MRTDRLGAETVAADGGLVLSHMADLQARVVRIGELHGGCPSDEIIEELHSLRRVARSWHFDSVADLAHILASEIGICGDAAPVSVFTECMTEAIASNMAHPVATETMLATIRARMLS